MGETAEDLVRGENSIENFPVGPVDAVLALGMGPVRPQLRGVVGERQVVIDFDRMRVIAIAVKELAANGYVLPEGKIVPSGRNTANANDVDAALASRSNDLQLFEQIRREVAEPELTGQRFDRNEFQHVVGRPADLAEREAVVKISEARLMSQLITDTVVKPGPANRRELLQQIVPDENAANTLQNVIDFLNIMEEKSPDGLWTGNAAMVSSNFGHLERIAKIFEALGIDDSHLVPLSAEQVLRHFHYSDNAEFTKEYKELVQAYLLRNLDPGTIQNQEKFLKGVERMPEYVIPEIYLIKSDKRLLSVLNSLKNFYGKELFEKSFPEISHFEDLPVDKLREILVGLKDKRKMPSVEWGKEANLEEWKARIVDDDKRTEKWLEDNFPGKSL